MEPRRTAYLRGQRFGGYTIEEELGRGSLTSIYRVRKSGQAQTHALMVITLPGHLSERGRERFLARFDLEATRLAALSHPHIFPVEGWGQQGGDPYLLLSDLDGGRTLADELRAHGRSSLAYAAAVVDRVAETLEYAHSHDVLHRSLSPTRILLREDLFVQVTGFGMAQLLEKRGIEETDAGPQAHLQTLSGAFFTPAEYLAPEVVQGNLVSAQADVYALGILLFELLCGRPPFRGETYLETAFQHVRSPLPRLSALCPEVPLALELVIHQALKRDPRQRFQSPRDLANACMRVLTRRPFTVVLAGRAERGIAAGASTRGQHEHTGGAERWAMPVALGAAPPGASSTLRLVPSALPAKTAASKKTSRTTVKLGSTVAAPDQAGASSGTNEAQVGALFALLEGMPRPSYGAAAGAHMLVQVPEPVPSRGLGSLRYRIGSALAELLPVPALPSALWRRRKFDSMFPHG